MQVIFPDLPWMFGVQIGDVNGVWQIVGLRIEGAPVQFGPDDERPLLWAGGAKNGIEPTITTDLLRQLPLRQLREMAVRRHRGEDDLLEPFVLERPAGGWGEEHYRTVAQVYRNAPDAPLKAISQRWGVSRAAASKWVRKARELGLLGYPTRVGVAGASEKASPITPRKKRQPRTGAER